MTTNDKIKRQVVAWAEKLGAQDAILKLKRFGISERMAYYLISGNYDRSLSLKKAEQLLRAMK